MPTHLSSKSILPTLIAGALTLAAGQALAADKFKVTSVDCEMFFVWKHTPVIHYDIVDERRADYDANPDADYFRQAASRTAAYCDRTSARPETAMGPPRKIRGVWFQSNDGQFKILYDLDRDGVDASAGIVNAFGDRHAAAQRAAAQHEAQLEAMRTRDARAKELEATRLRLAQEKVATENARQKFFFDSEALQVSRLGAKVRPANFATIQDVRDNPFHFSDLGLVVVPTQFNRMVNRRLALFGNVFAPIFIGIDDVDRFTHSGETVMLAFRVSRREEAERSYGSVPEVILSAIKADPIWGEYVGAYSCPTNGCMHLFDAPAGADQVVPPPRG